MNFATNFAIYSVVICAALCSVNANELQDGEACLVQYLQRKDKLSADFQSDVPASSQCRLMTPLTIQIIRSTINDLIRKEIPNAADCLTEQFNDKEEVDHFIKIGILDASQSLSDSERTTQLETSRN